MTRALSYLSTNRIATIRNEIDSRQVSWLLVGLWIASMISLPIWLWTIGEASIRWSVTITVLLLAAANLSILMEAWGGSRTFATALVVVSMAWLIEYIGSTTGFPFGEYHYTDLLVPHIGHVPLIIPIAWLMMMPPAWAVAATITGKSKGLAFILVSALAFTAWDLYLDPQMVHWEFWLWDQPGLYFGIPLVNFAGWIMAAAAITFAARPAPVPQIPGLLIYSLTWMLQMIGLYFFWHMPGPALWGGAGMGIFVVIAWRRMSTYAANHA